MLLTLCCHFCIIRIIELLIKTEKIDCLDHGKVFTYSNKYQAEFRVHKSNSRLIFAYFQVCLDRDIDEFDPRNQLRNDTQPHEFVELIVQLLSTVIPLITEVFRFAVKRKKDERVEIDFRNNRVVI